MRRVSPRLITLVLVALVAIGGGAQTASASDAGLRKLVSQQRAGEQRLTAKIKSAGNRVETSNTFGQYRRRVSRYVRSMADIFRQQARSDDRLRARFQAEAPQTAKAKQGRALMISGLRDDASALRSSASRLGSVERQVRRVRSERDIKRVVRSYDRALTSKRASRGNSRIERGRTAIRKAPKVATPTPTPAPTPVPTPVPAPGPSTTPAPAPPSLLPGLL